MSERLFEQPSTSVQASEVFEQIGELTVLQGNRNNSTYSFGEKTIDFPDSISFHFPEVEDDQAASKTLYVTQKFDIQTGIFKLTGVVANLMFKQKEKRSGNLIYSTNANYQIVSDDGHIFRLQRYVTSSGYDRSQLGLDLATYDAVEEELRVGHMIANGTYSSDSFESKLGIFDVSAQEANEIVDILVELNAAR